MKTYTNTIKSVLADDGIELYLEKCHLSSLIKACKLTPNNENTYVHLPLQKGMIRVLVDKTHHFYLIENNQPYLALLFKCLIVTAYYELFRIGELTESTHAIRLGDVKLA